jgi:hypothetical protein
LSSAREPIRDRGFADVIYADALLAWDEVTASITLRLRGRW